MANSTKQEYLCPLYITFSMGKILFCENPDYFMLDHLFKVIKLFQSVFNFICDCGLLLDYNYKTKYKN